MATYTYVRYFTPDDPLIDELRETIKELREDFDLRRPFIGGEAAAAGDQRLALLELAADLLVEPVPKPFGG